MSTHLLKPSFRLFWALTRFLLRFSAESLEILADATRAPKNKNFSPTNLIGGELNFRTGKFDEGNDPAGWYGRD